VVGTQGVIFSHRKDCLKHKIFFYELVMFWSTKINTERVRCTGVLCLVTGMQGKIGT
jgi:hypothetical protein